MLDLCSRGGKMRFSGWNLAGWAVLGINFYWSCKLEAGPWFAQVKLVVRFKLDSCHRRTFSVSGGSNSRSIRNTVDDQGSPFGELYRSPLVQPALERPALGFLSQREQPLARLLARPPSWRGPGRACGIQGNWSAWHRWCGVDMVQLGAWLNHLGPLQESSGQRSRTVRARKLEGPWQRVL